MKKIFLIFRRKYQKAFKLILTVWDNRKCKNLSILKAHICTKSYTSSKCACVSTYAFFSSKEREKEREKKRERYLKIYVRITGYLFSTFSAMYITSEKRGRNTTNINRSFFAQFRNIFSRQKYRRFLPFICFSTLQKSDCITCLRNQRTYRQR